MRADVHPEYGDLSVRCSCGNVMQLRSTLQKELQVEICSQCHPFYTGQQKQLKGRGRVERHRKRYEGLLSDS